MAPILRPENGTHFNYQLYWWSQIRGPDSGHRTGAANFSIFRAFWRPGAVFFAAPEETNGLPPEGFRLQPRTRFVAAPDHNPSAGPASHTLRSVFLNRGQLSRPRPGSIWIRAVCLVGPLPPQSRPRRSQPFSAILLFHPVKQPSLFHKFASFGECQLASFRCWLRQEILCVLCQRLHFVPDLVLRPRRLILPLSPPLVQKFYGGGHIQSHNPDTQSCAHTERPRKHTSTLPGHRTARQTCLFTLNSLFDFPNCHRQLLQLALATGLHGLGADTRNAFSACNTADHKNPETLEHKGNHSDRSKELMLRYMAHNIPTWHLTKNMSSSPTSSFPAHRHVHLPRKVHVRHGCATVITHLAWAAQPMGQGSPEDKQATSTRSLTCAPINTEACACTGTTCARGRYQKLLSTYIVHGNGLLILLIVLSEKSPSSDCLRDHGKV